MDTTTAFQNIRTTLATIVALQPMTGTATVHGNVLVIRDSSLTASMWTFQHDGVNGGLRASYRDMDENGATTAWGQAVTPLQTNEAVTDYLRALVVEVLR